MYEQRKEFLESLGSCPGPVESTPTGFPIIRSPSRFSLSQVRWRILKSWESTADLRQLSLTYFTWPLLGQIWTPLLSVALPAGIQGTSWEMFSPYLDISHLHHTIKRCWTERQTGQVCTLSVLTIFIEVPNCSSMKICHRLSTCNRKGEKRAGHSTNRSAVRWCWPMGEEERIVVATIQANLDLTMVQIKLQYLHKKGVCRWASPGIGISFSSSTLSFSTPTLLSLINSVGYLIVFLSTEC